MFNRTLSLYVLSLRQYLSSSSPCFFLYVFFLYPSFYFLLLFTFFILLSTWVLSLYFFLFLLYLPIFLTYVMSFCFSLLFYVLSLTFIICFFFLFLLGVFLLSASLCQCNINIFLLLHVLSFSLYMHVFCFFFLLYVLFHSFSCTLPLKLFFTSASVFFLSGTSIFLNFTFLQVRVSLSLFICLSPFPLRTLSYLWSILFSWMFTYQFLTILLFSSIYIDVKSLFDFLSPCYTFFLHLFISIFVFPLFLYLFFIWGVMKRAACCRPRKRQPSTSTSWKRQVALFN